jgi:hypothetical protein
MSKPEKRPHEMDPRPLLGDSTSDALDAIDIPSYILDASGRLRWVIEAARALSGKRHGQSYLTFVADDARDRAGGHLRL